MDDGSLTIDFPGEVTEWPKVYDWKSYVPQKGTAGSTPALSALLRPSASEGGPGFVRSVVMNETCRGAV